MARSTDARKPHWLWDGVRVGLATSVLVPVGVVSARVLPALVTGYPLVLLPLLLTGPLAVWGRRAGQGLLVALVAGVVSGVVAALSLVFGQQVLGTFNWGLLPAA